MTFLSTNSLSIRELAFLTIFVGLILVTSHLYFGILGLVATMIVGLAILSFPFLQSIKGSFLLIYFITSAFVLDTREGIQVAELPFFGLSVILILLVAYKALMGRLILENALDYFFLLLHFLIPYAVVLGKLNGAATYTALGEVVYFLGVFTYFPLRDHLNNEQFKKALGFIVLLILGFVLIRNFVYYRQILAQALLPWQAESARVAANEIIVVAGCSLSLAAASLTTRRSLQLFSTGLFLVFMVSLILTQSRGYWVAGFFSVITIFIVIDRKGKKRILLTASMIVVLGILIANLLFDDLFTLIINGLDERLRSIGSGTTDNSLQDRWLESKTVFGHILDNPIAGYGFGTEFTRKKIFFDIFVRTNFIHNGYLGALFKFGALGFISFVSIWFLLIKKSIGLYKVSGKIFPLAIAGIVVGMLFVNNTSSQIQIFEGIAITSLAAAYINSELKEFE
jgi:O-antigen ligase